MTKKEEKILHDLIAFIVWGIVKKRRFMWILSNVGHDVSGLVHEVKGFFPRTSGYAEHCEKLPGVKLTF